MIVTNGNVSNAMKFSVRGVLMKADVSVNVTTVINSAARIAITKQSILFTHAIDVMSNVAKIADSKGIDRESCIAQDVSKRVCRF